MYFLIKFYIILKSDVGSQKRSCPVDRVEELVSRPRPCYSRHIYLKHILTLSVPSLIGSLFFSCFSTYLDLGNPVLGVDLIPPLNIYIRGWQIVSWGPAQPIACFVNKVLLGTASLIYTSIAEVNSLTETIWPIKSKIFTILPFTENDWQPLVCIPAPLLPAFALMVSAGSCAQKS